MCCRRVRTGRSRQRRTRRRIATGVEDGNASRSGRPSRILATVSLTVAAPKAVRPASISYSTQPKAQISARWSTAAPRACSGAMYVAVPRMTPGCVIAVVMVGECDSDADTSDIGSSAFARPKSSTFTVPSGRSLMLAGFKSRWMTRCSCADSSASAICAAICSASSSRNRSARDALCEIVALDQFHHKGGHAPALFEAVDGGDVWVVQRGEGLGFTLEACEPISVVCERLGQDLDRDVAIQLRIAGAKNLPHAAFADAGDNFVDTETGTGSKRQG